MSPMIEIGCKRGLDIVCDSMKISKCTGGIYPKSISVTFFETSDVKSRLTSVG